MTERIETEEGHIIELRYYDDREIVLTVIERLKDGGRVSVTVPLTGSSVVELLDALDGATVDRTIRDALDDAEDK